MEVDSHPSVGASWDRAARDVIVDLAPPATSRESVPPSRNRSQSVKRRGADAHAFEQGRCPDSRGLLARWTRDGSGALARAGADGDPSHRDRLGHGFGLDGACPSPGPWCPRPSRAVSTVDFHGDTARSSRRSRLFRTGSALACIGVRCRSSREARSTRVHVERGDSRALDHARSPRPSTNETEVRRSSECIDPKSGGGE